MRPNRSPVFHGLAPPVLHDLPLSGQMLPLRSYTARDGLASNAVRCMTEDSFGYLWIGTTDGVSIFDGVCIRTISIPEGLSCSNVNSIVESRTSPGVMGVTTSGEGVYRVMRGLAVVNMSILN